MEFGAFPTAGGAEQARGTVPASQLLLFPFTRTSRPEKKKSTKNGGAITN